MCATPQHVTWALDLRETLSNFIDLTIQREYCALSSIVDVYYAFPVSGRCRIYQRDKVIPDCLA